MPILSGLTSAVAATALFHLVAWSMKAEGIGEQILLHPRDSMRGYLNFEIAPPHNEPDPGLCPVPEALSALPRCSAFARYVWSGYLEVQPFGRGPLKQFFVFGEPRVYGGDNVPQQRYTYAPDLIIMERKYGVGVNLPRGFQLRMTQHNTVLLGKYKALVLPIWRPDGPDGLYTTVGVRWYFGSWANDRRE